MSNSNYNSGSMNGNGNGNGNDNGNNQSIPIKTGKRNRPSFVCSNCRRKKIRCDRQMPCHNCARMGCSDTCEYSVPTLNHLFEKTKRKRKASESIVDLDEDDQEEEEEEEEDDDDDEDEEDEEDDEEEEGANGDDLSGMKVHKGKSIEDRSLKREMSVLKTQIHQLEALLNNMNGGKKGKQINKSSKKSEPDSILDIKIDALKSFKVIKKPSRTSIYGPLFVFSLSRSVISPNIAKIFHSLIGREREAWKKRHGPNKYLPSLINALPDLEEMVASIETNLVPYCNAILERLLYFKDKLNNLLYNGFVDMDHVMICFKTFFKIQDNGKYIFIRPEKTYTYSDLSLILTIIDSVILFTLYQNSIIFFHQVDEFTGNTISNLSTQTLAISKYNRKHSYSSLMTLLILRDNNFMYSSRGNDIIDESKSFFLWNAAISLAFQLGVHRDQESINEYIYKKDSANEFEHHDLDGSIYHIPAYNSRELWSYLRLLDASYSLNVGTPLMINDTFSDSRVATISQNPMVQLINLQREATTLMNSVNPISLRDIIKLREDALNLNLSLGTFKELIALREEPVSYSDLVSIARIVSIKLKIFRIISMVGKYLNDMIPITGIYPADKLTTENLKILHQQSELYEIETIKCTLANWALVKHLCDSEANIFGNQDQYIQFLIYLKSDLLNLLFPEVFLSAIYLARKPVSTSASTTYHGKFKAEYFTREINDFEIIKLDTINYHEIELSLTSNLDENSSKDENNHLKLMFRNPEQTISFFCEIHACLTKHLAITETYSYFCLLKFLSIFSCFADSIIKLSKSRTNPNEVKFDDIFKQTKAKMAATMKLGVVDLGFDLEDDSDSIENWLTSLFDEEGLINLFYENKPNEIGDLNRPVHVVDEMTMPASDTNFDGSPNNSSGTRPVSGSYQMFF